MKEVVRGLETSAAAQRVVVDLVPLLTCTVLVPGGWFRTREARGVCTCRSCCDSSLVTTALQLRAPFITVDQTLAPAENGSEDNTIFHLRAR